MRAKKRVKKIKWRVDLGVYMPFCPHCGEPAYEHDKCAFCGKEYEWVEGKHHGTEVAVGDYTVYQATNNHITICKGDQMVMHINCRKKMTEEELAAQVDFYEEIIKKRM